MNHGKFIEYLSKYYRLRKLSTNVWVDYQKMEWVYYNIDPEMYFMDRHLISTIRYLYEIPCNK